MKALTVKQAQLIRALETMCDAMGKVSELWDDEIMNTVESYPFHRSLDELHLSVIDYVEDAKNALKGGKSDE